MLPLWVLTIIIQSLSRLSQIGHLPAAVQIKAEGSIDVNDGGDPHGGEVAQACEDTLNVDQFLYIFKSLPFPDTATGHRDRRMSNAYRYRERQEHILRMYLPFPISIDR